MKTQAPKITPDKDLRDSALKHYEEASNAIHHWNSDIPKAIIQYFENLLPVSDKELVIKKYEKITMHAFDRLVKDLDSGELSIRLLELAYREHIRNRKDIPEGVKNLLVPHEGAGLIHFAANVGQIVGNMELAFRRGGSK